MSDDLPSLYYAEQQSPRTWAVIYDPSGKDEEVFCFVTARSGEPDEDAKYRAGMLARVMNATVDMTVHDIRDMLRAYERIQGHQHHADWRGEDAASDTQDTDSHE